MQTLGVQYTLSDWARARQSAVDWTSSASPRAQGIFATDEFCTHGVIAAFDTAEKNRPVIVGAAQESDQLDALASGKADVMIVSDPVALAQRSLATLMALMQQQTAPAEQAPELYAVDAHWRQDPRVPFLLQIR